MREVNRCIKTYLAGAGRSSHRLALMSAEKLYAAREAVCGLVGIDAPEAVVFTLNATYALNMAIKTTVERGSHILISDLEHNSVLRPIYKLSRTDNVSFSVFRTSVSSLEDEIERHITKTTRAIVSTLGSNVTGKTIPLSLLSRIRKRHNLKLIVDASQVIGHEVINLKKTPVDVLCAPGHKALFGIAGIGFAIFLDKSARESFIEGGSGIDSLNPLMPEDNPEHFEAGTLPIPAAVSLLEGISYINSVGIPEIKARLDSNLELILARIESIPGAVIFSEGLGILSFKIDDIPSSVIASELDRAGIFTRSGLHCAPLVHEALGTVKQGLVRISLSYLNRAEDADKLYTALSQIRKKY